ncbi:DNA polymerase delta catalytic subunit-like protein [Dinothrombium tinctorium]|uniref:DNA polymerase n=1 Tax=Dinothrombium tinctorium TaxID=1965070 RepID=A0A3S3NGK4_9ACAR|nr:DNA polymerase delta catalytic subunit-like protein [Dinothrombium tinctorium]RWS02261.1 DNA polymerase delta catalytic subunit-like protein [Dinothrombium tinctorium]RWS02362.1 DNA polymerase delta catalytic subunit-like protein [Dinothrombium tinctorium]
MIKSIDLVSKQSVLYYQNNNEKNNFLKVTLFSFYDRKCVIDAFEEAYGKSVSFYNTDIPYVTQFLVDNDISGCSWLSLKPKTYKCRVENFRKRSHCNIECDAHFSKVTLEKGEEVDSIANVRILSIDIECLNGVNGEFPSPSTNEVICIGNVIFNSNSNLMLDENVKKVTFTLGSCEIEENASKIEIFSFSNENLMLQEWSNFLRTVDPDIITGYNTQNFDIPYLLKRAKFLQINSFSYLGRWKYTLSMTKEKAFQSNQLGNRINCVTNISGRVQIDMLNVMQRDFKLRSYKLDDVAQSFLKEQKEDVHFFQIRDLFFESDKSRGKLASYCSKDALLPLKLLEKLMVIVKNVEMARVTGISMSEVLSRGQQVRIMSQLLRKCKSRDMVIPRVAKNSNIQKYVGAYVIEPKKNFYNVPIATLDFVSLYPSIMIANNLCYSTLLSQELIEKYNLKLNEDYICSPSKSCFVKKHLYSGLLPEILESLVDRRKYVKNLLKIEKDEMRKQILDGRQLALKITANSVYGFTGAQNGMLPCIDISQSVTSFGQQMLIMTKNFIEEYYPNSEIIYGDTDSVMVNFNIFFTENTLPEKKLEMTMNLAREAAKKITEKFISPIQLDFEKVYFPYLLISKKRYSGLLYTKPDTFDKIDSKGLETVRRDNCKLVQECMNNVLECLLMRKNPEEAIEYAKNVIEQLKNNSLPLEKLIISKQLSKLNYKVKQAHIELAKKIESRKRGSGPKLGDRVPYVIVKTDLPKSKEKLYMKAEDPDFVKEKNLEIDVTYYVNKQLSKPLTRLLEPVVGEEEAKRIFYLNEKKKIVKRKNKISNEKEKIDFYFKRIKNN